MLEGLLVEAGEKYGVRKIRKNLDNETYLETDEKNFAGLCHFLHKKLDSSVKSFFAVDDRKKKDRFVLYAGFLEVTSGNWIFVELAVDPSKPEFPSLASTIYSASLFEREIKEMFGLTPAGHPDMRGLRLHEEVWPAGYFPLRKDFIPPPAGAPGTADFVFRKIGGEGVFEVPVGPVHAGVIGPGHFRFSVAGEPIIHLEARLGFTHRGVEKLFESRDIHSGIRLAECVSGDSAFGHSLAFSSAVERILGIEVPDNAARTRAIFLELERIYNHVADIGGMAVDVGFSFPAARASLVKESIHHLNEHLTGSRFLKNVNRIGGIASIPDPAKRKHLLGTLDKTVREMYEIEKILKSSVSFMDRVDATGVLRTRTARDLGVLGLAGRASGIPIDMRKVFPGIYASAGFTPVVLQKGDAEARLEARFREIRQSLYLISKFVEGFHDETEQTPKIRLPEHGFAMGCSEGWRGPILTWVQIGPAGKIDRCKIVDPSFHNWEGLCYAVLGNIVPDFPLCNKSFDLSYSGNDL